MAEATVAPTAVEQAEKMYLRPEAVVAEQPAPVNVGDMGGGMPAMAAIPPTLEVQSSSGNKWLVWVLVGVIILAGLGLGGWAVWGRGGSKPAPEITSPTAEVVTVPTPTPTPVAEVDKNEFKIRVLNGSGISGEAGRVKELLEEAEFVVSGTGNAEKFDYKETMIDVKSKVGAAFIEELKKTLAEKYMLSSGTGTLESTASADVQVIVGSGKAGVEE